MNESPARQVAQRSAPSLMLACLLLAVAAVAAGAVAGWFAYARHGLSGVAAVAIADATCFLAAAAALVLAFNLRNTPHAISGILSGTVVRMVAPLTVAGGCKLLAPELFGAGLLGCFLVFFLLALVVETALLLWTLGFGSSVSGAKPASKAV